MPDSLQQKIPCPLQRVAQDLELILTRQRRQTPEPPVLMPFRMQSQGKSLAFFRGVLKSIAVFSQIGEEHFVRHVEKKQRGPRVKNQRIFYGSQASVSIDEEDIGLSARAPWAAA